MNCLWPKKPGFEKGSEAGLSIVLSPVDTAMPEGQLRNSRHRDRVFALIVTD